MYKTSSFFIKAQIPGISIPGLLQFYRQELEEQSISDIEVDENSLRFSNEVFRLPISRSANKYSGFTSGRITIEENGDEYLVLFEGDNARNLVVAGVVAGTVTLISLFRSAFEPTSLIMGVIVFAVIAGIGYGSTMLTFPVYFTGLRNRIERRIQSGEPAPKAAWDDPNLGQR